MLQGEQEITTNIQLACVTQRIWLLISNICHGLLAGLALAHLLFVLSTHPMEWSKALSSSNLLARQHHWKQYPQQSNPQLPQ
ncbi:hypothetical protein CVS40_11436 [Lucilia cuprina]|nr:hypothetical protein CVS40_11436 [Lucilia cuprina]